MNTEFERVTEPYTQLDAVQPDPRVKDYRVDGFQANPCPLPWADYRKVKTILLQVLGSRVFEVLFRPNRKMDGIALKTASSILFDYVSKPEETKDLQTTLIANLIAYQCGNVRKDSAAQAIEQVLSTCHLEKEYHDHVLNVIFAADGPFEVPWWTAVYF